MTERAARDLVTVVIPVHDGARHLAATLDSVARQTHPHVEVVVVDDGSADDGPELAAAHPLRPIVIHQSHLGVAVARNRGLALANGRWVTFLDQDDLWHPQRLERLLSWLAEHPRERLVATTEVAFATDEEVDRLTALDPLVGTWASEHVPESAALDELVARSDAAGSAGQLVEHIDHRGMLRGPITVTTSFLAEAELLRLAGGFAPHALAMDDYWLLVNAARLCPIARVDQPTVFYRVHLGATSRSTRLALPFLSSAVALRLGGGLVPLDEGLDGSSTGPLHAHLLDELLRAGAVSGPARRAAGHLAELLWRDGRRTDRAKASLRRTAPWLAAAYRRVRPGG